MKRIVYAGSFDPPTIGHEWMIGTAAGCFDNVVVAIGVNPDKKSMFTTNKRLEMLRGITAKFGNVSVTSFENRYLVDFARDESIGCILRGIRSSTDYEYERSMRYFNGDRAPEIVTMILMPPRELAEVSSSFVKGLMGPQGWEAVVGQYLHPLVHEHLLAQWSEHYDLRVRWRKLWKRIGGCEDPNPLFEKIVQHYGESHRHYHALEHVRQCLRALDEVEKSWGNIYSRELELAIWFHDIIYDTGEQLKKAVHDNEERSADFAAEILTHGKVSKECIARVRELIMVTANHEQHEELDAQLLSDIDLGILGCAPSAFQEYAQQIRKEYIWVPEDVYRQTRASILGNFLARARIYQTEYFHERLEAQARENLAHAITTLRHEN